ncbi:ATP-binding cassette domain-containing protein [Gynuella sunshinyii]|uniref:ABC-type molybdenum transport system, ATPase component/photorepair protein PhrA n=1 Tax=Gynuella sunshinyii YC6258 TaxID=1445510 RepID=A0A0C5VR34_9GAMM|nr:ATP-binding cassette domain-containing protein [Gynuella sunshinyii]AJQ96701.1 ABC-type molybdenum transport system, ATPase component/photorepair protein PhrA [Gynuella sunshinyii YC6258]
MKNIDIQNLRSDQLQISHWHIEAGQHWCLLGTTGSGKSQLARILEQDDEIAFQADALQLPESCVCVGFEAQMAQLEAELYDDDTDFMDQLDYGHTGREILAGTGADECDIDELIHQFGIEYLMDRGFRVLSSGETRKLLIARAMLTNPQLLILDEPFEGLDRQSCTQLTEFLAILKDRQAIMIFASQLQDIQAWHTHVAVLHQGHLLLQGEKPSVLTDDTIQRLFHFDSSQLPELPPALTPAARFDPILSMENSRVQYGDTIQFEHLNWCLRPGQHTLISGPNGAGKSTLLQLITGDHPQCFNNGLTVFGYRRGSGESIWDIKKHIGLVSGSLHQDYRVPGNAISVTASGFHDSIGLYRPVSAKEKNISVQWLSIVGLADRANHPFRSLSWGEQRLVLIARALVKHPPLLILDEPTLGLDDQNRFMVLACLERIAQLNTSTVLFVSHRQDEQLPVFNTHLQFVANDGPALYRIVQNQVDSETADI